MSRNRRSLSVVFTALAATVILWPADAEAQRRAVRRAPTRSVVVVGVGHPYYHYYPRYYDPFYWGWYGYPYYRPYPPHYWHTYDYTGAARLQVSPKQTQVYVDGYFVGIVDDFDGTLQRLRLEPGEHELQFFLEGYRTATQKVLFRPGATLKITHAMEPLASGEVSERPTPSQSPGQPVPSRQDPYRPSRPGERMPPEGPVRGDVFGTLSLRVQPADAEVTIDGERWDAPEGGSRLLVELSEGSHRVEIRKDGYRTYSAVVRIRRGETETLNVSLNQD